MSKKKTSKLVFLCKLDLCSEVPGIAHFKEEFSRLGSVNYHDIT